MDITQIITIGLAAIGSARLIFKGLEGLAKLTKTDKDDKFIAKVLNALGIIAETISVPESKSKLTVKVR